MGRVRFVTPGDYVRLALSDGDWIEVKKRLTVGEARKATTSFVGVYRPDGSRTPNDETLGMGMVLAYLVDWSFRDAQDKPVQVSLDALKQLDLASYAEIDDALDAHVKAMQAEDEEREKKLPASSGAASSPTS